MLRSETRQAASLREIVCPAGRARRPSLHRLRHRAVALGLRESFAQLAPQNLPRWRARDDLHKANLAGLLVPGETVGDEVAKFFGEHVRRHEALAENDERAGDFSGVEVRLRDYPTIADGGMFQKEGFDFGGRDGESFVLDHLFAAVEDVVEAVGVAAHDVAGEVPAIAKNGGGGFWLLPVSEHDLRAAHNEFAGLARRDLIPVKINDATIRENQWLSNGSGAVHFRWSDVADVSDGRSFGHAVSLDDANAGEIGHASGEFGSERRGAALDPANFVILWEDASFGGLAERIDGGRDHGHHGDAFLKQKSAQLLGVEARHQNQRRAERERKSQRHGESVDVVKGEEAEHDIIGCEHRRIRTEDLIDIRDQVVVREHHAFRQSGGAAGVGKGGDSYLRGLDSVREFGGRGPQQTGEVFAACALTLHVEAARAEDATQARKSCEVHVFEKRSVGDEESGARVFQLIADLALAV